MRKNRVRSFFAWPWWVWTIWIVSTMLAASVIFLTIVATPAKASSPGMLDEVRMLRQAVEKIARDCSR